MEAVRTYIYSIASAATICAVLVALAGKSSILSPIMKLMTGVVMTAVIIAPISGFQEIPLNRYLDQLNRDAQTFAAEGLETSRESMENRIISSTEAYILEKAGMYGLSIRVSVRLDEQQLTPASVEIQGDVSPSAKRELQIIIAENLGIPPEAQTWK